ncbi:MAG: sorbosone dehydrogenase family protein [Hyphomonadaceae bacterium]
MRTAILALTAVFVVGCTGPSGPPNANVDGEYGPNPTLTAPEPSGFLPTVVTARPVGWAADETPDAPEGFTVTRYAGDLSHPRRPYLLPNGDVLVAESSTQPSRGGGLMGWAANQVQRGAGSIVESANRITLLRDSDGDGVVDERFVFLEGLNQPFGMALVGDSFYVGNTDAVLRFPYTENQTRLEGPGQVVVSLPHNDGANGHWTRDLLASPDGRRLFVGIGSVSNIADQGMEIEEGRAAVWEIDLASASHRVFASGLRNPNGLTWNPESGALWVVVNERDALGDHLVPDYMTSVREGGFYGWPYSYYGQHLDERVTPQNAELVARAIAPDYAVGAHTAALGLAFYTGQAFPERYRNGAFVAQHGSWNRASPAGYRVIFVPFAGGAPAGGHEEFLGGFLNAVGQARGRPVGLALDRTGALLVADDVGNVVWRVAADAPAPPAD